jgi:pimeloyl-ACP methyl ester carboxylesterase
MTTVEANGVTLGIAHFGDAAAPLVLCAGGTTMLSWPDALCESLARSGRHVVRYDLRDSGASITVDPEAPAYTLRDLAADAAALARELDHRPAHLAGIGVGGMVAQVAALETKAGTGGLAQLHSAAAPAVRDESRSASVASAATRSIAGCYGPMPRRLRIRTCSPRSANSVAVAAPTGPAPTMTCSDTCGSLLRTPAGRMTAIAVKLALDRRCRRARLLHPHIGMSVHSSVIPHTAWPRLDRMVAGPAANPGEGPFCAFRTFASLGRVTALLGHA